MESLEWYKTESTNRPEEIDKTSSKVYNYIRRNIVETERKFEDETVKVYEYEEMKIEKEDFDTYEKLEKQRADIDYIAVMADIEL